LKLIAKLQEVSKRADCPSNFAHPDGLSSLLSQVIETNSDFSHINGKILN